MGSHMAGAMGMAVAVAAHGQARGGGKTSVRGSGGTRRCLYNSGAREQLLLKLAAGQRCMGTRQRKLVIETRPAALQCDASGAGGEPRQRIHRFIPRCMIP